MYKHFFKRVIDIVLSFLGITVSGIPMLIVALIIKINDPGEYTFQTEKSRVA